MRSPKRIFHRVGFRHATKRDAARTMGIVHAFSFEAHRRAVEALAVPVFIAHCRDDSMVEADIVEALGAACPDGPRLWFDTGGHNVQKSRAVEVGEALVTWIGTLGL